MESSRVFLILIGIYCVTLVRAVNDECCVTSHEVTFTMENGTCQEVGGEGVTICIALICADGSAKNGYFCGRGNCDEFGCDCIGGCLTGEFSKSFEQKNQKYGIKVLSWQPLRRGAKKM